MFSALLIDADPASVKLESLALREAGWTVVSAPTLLDAHTALETFAPRVVVLGLALDPSAPVFVAARARGIPIVLVATHHDPEVEHAARAAGCAGYIPRPLDVAAFTAEIHHAIGAHP